MKRSKWRMLAVFVIIAIISASVFSISYAAAGTKKMLEAWFGTTNIRYNGQNLTFDAGTEPFSWNQTTYIPLRKMTEIFNMQIAWDGATQTVLITDPREQTIADLKNQLMGKDFTIQELDTRVKNLQAQLTAAQSGSADLDDLEDQLTDDYGDYGDAEFDIILDGDEDDISVEIGIDMDDYKTEWNDLSSTKRKNFIQDIVDDILDEFEDADIEGYVYDSSRSGTYKLLSFTVSSSGKVSITSSGDLSDLEDELNDEFYDVWDDIEIDIELDGDEDDIVFTVNIDTAWYEDEWENITETTKKYAMRDIYEYIESEYEDADIEGYIYDTDEGDNIYHFYKSSSGSYILETE